MVTICVFTMEGCPHCQHLKERLGVEGIDYTQYDISDNQFLWSQIVSQVGEENLPTVFIKRDDNTEGLLLMPDISVKSEDEMIEKIINELKK